MPRIKLFWKLLLAFFVACTLGVVGAWGTLLTTICSNPRTPVPETGNVIAYSCHGMIVYMSRFENGMFYWLFPLGALFIFLTVVTAILAFLSAAKVTIDVQVRYENRNGPRA